MIIKQQWYYIVLFQIGEDLYVKNYMRLLFAAISLNTLNK